ncbi:hypothetical protein L3X38_030467 [Prunus dulcis]|uniref:Uncharacterized protein n=1 Tax=Prunus dulcis TaxID=3755 RepID=A0AAD4YU24_PRUDU|nr:hypothetical protein L3X38_030467 [Prunus dulcis]
MADTSQTWKEHSFTNCIALPYEFEEKSLAVKMSDGNWLIFMCLCNEVVEFEDDHYCCCDEYECVYSSDVDDYPPQPEPHRHYEWQPDRTHPEFPKY